MSMRALLLGVASGALLTGGGGPPAGGITPIGVVSADATGSITIPAHQAGDIIIAYLSRDGSNTIPTLASGWTSISAVGGGGVATQVAYKIAAGSSETMGTWGTHHAVTVEVYRGVDNANPIGAVATDPATSTTSTDAIWPGLSLVVTDGSSWVIGYMAVNDAAPSNITTPPSGMTYSDDHLSARPNAQVVHNTAGGVASWAGDTVVLTGTVMEHRQLVFELRAA